MKRPGFGGDGDLTPETAVMPALWKFDSETRERAVRLYADRRRQHPAESQRGARRHVGELLGINQLTLRNWFRASGGEPRHASRRGGGQRRDQGTA